MLNEKIEQVFINIIVEVLKSKDIYLNSNNINSISNLYKEFNLIKFEPCQIELTPYGNIEFDFGIEIDKKTKYENSNFKCLCIVNDFCCNEIDLHFKNNNNQNSLGIQILKYNFTFDDEIIDYESATMIDDCKRIIFDTKQYKPTNISHPDIKPIEGFIEIYKNERIIWNIVSYLEELKYE